ncbi:MAG: ribulokinase [Spirochaetales bacterium]|nr:ribulokinase [Spirochaetales bacterium]
MRIVPNLAPSGGGVGGSSASGPASGSDAPLVLGLDFGTDSVRAVVVSTADGRVLGQAVSSYPRWAKGLYCDPTKSQFRQHPLDYIESFEAAVKGALAASPSGAGARVVGLSIDTTASTPILADETGTPLAFQEKWKDDPDAQFILWKDHTSIAEAEDINKAAADWEATHPGQNPVLFVGGIYSSEWYWAKVLRVLRRRPELAAAAATALEHCDWMGTFLTGTKDVAKIKRSRTAGGHKILWHQDFGGYPPAEFFARLHPKLADIAKSLGTKTYTGDTSLGTLTAEWADRLGLSRTCVVGVGSIDAHVGAVGAGVGPYQLAKVVGTSTCDILVAPPVGKEKVVAGICGQVDGSVVPGIIGYEAGQSAFGDAYNWFKQVLLWPLHQAVGLGANLSNGEGTDAEVSADAEMSAAAAVLARVETQLLDWLGTAAEAISPGESGVVALDWLNGRRTPDADQNLRGAFAGLNLGTDAPRMFRALVEATAFGSRAILERFKVEGVRIDSVIALGGISGKSSFVMQTLADVMGVEIAISAAEQAGALGSAMFAAVAAGVYPNIGEAQTAMGAGFTKSYKPRPENAGIYDRLYREYLVLGATEEKLAKSRS